MSVRPVAIAGPSSYTAVLDEAWQQHLAPRSADAPTVISLFAGCGGSSLGYSMAGYREVLAVERDPMACATFRLNFPDVPVYEGNIEDLTAAICLAQSGMQPGQLDVLDGSPPCQGFSTAGKRQMADARNTLFREYVRLLAVLQPKAIIMENVSGMVKGKMKLIFAEILRALKEKGYRVASWLMNAKYFYVPQSRPRLIFLGIRDELGISPSPPPVLRTLWSVRMAFEGLSLHTQDPMRSHCWIPAKIGSKTYQALIRTRQGETLSGFSMSRRLAYHAQAGTIQTGGVAPGYPGSSWPSHPTEHRGISVREAARLSSFPDQFRFGEDWRMAARDIGNAVPPLFMRAIAQHVRTLLASPATPLVEA